MLFRNWCENGKFNSLRSSLTLIIRWYFINLTIFFIFFSRVSRKISASNGRLSNIHKSLMTFAWLLLGKQIVFWHTTAHCLTNSVLFNCILFFVAFLLIVINRFLSFNPINIFNFNFFLFIMTYFVIVWMNFSEFCVCQIFLNCTDQNNKKFIILW